MDASIVLQKIRRRGFVITPSGGQISIKPKKRLDERMIAFLQANKPVLLTALYQEQDDAKILHQKKMRALRPGRLHVLKTHIQRWLRSLNPDRLIPSDKETNDCVESILINNGYDLENAIDTHSFTTDLYGQDSISLTVTCDACDHFSPDTIGDGVGIGSCSLGMLGTPEPSGFMPSYRFAKRHCIKFTENKILESQEDSCQKNR